MSVHSKLDTKGNKVWYVKFRDENGTQRQTTPKPNSHKAAERLDRDLKTRRDRGEIINPDDANMTIGEYFTGVYLPAKITQGSTRLGVLVRWGSAKGPEHDRAWQVRKKFNRMSLKGANRRQIVDEWHGEMKRAGASSAQMYTAHKLLVAVLNHAVEYDYLPGLKIRGMYPEYTPARKPPMWLPAEVERVRRQMLRIGERGARRNSASQGQLYQWRRQRDAAVVALAGYHPTRIGEVFALEWPDALDRGRIAAHVDVSKRVPGVEEDDWERTKTGPDGRLLPLTTTGRADLRAWWMLCGQPTTGVVFPFRPDDQTWTTARVKNWRAFNWYVALDAAGLDRVPFKHLRDSSASMWVRARRDLKTVADAAGHSITVCQRTYIHAFKALEAGEAFDLDEAIATARSSGPDVRRMFADGR